MTTINANTTSPLHINTTTSEDTTNLSCQSQMTSRQPVEVRQETGVSNCNGLGTGEEGEDVGGENGGTRDGGTRDGGTQDGAN